MAGDLLAVLVEQRDAPGAVQADDQRLRGVDHPVAELLLAHQPLGGAAHPVDQRPVDQRGLQQQGQQRHAVDDALIENGAGHLGLALLLVLLHRLVQRDQQRAGGRGGDRAQLGRHRAGLLIDAAYQRAQLLDIVAHLAVEVLRLAEIERVHRRRHRRRQAQRSAAAGQALVRTQQQAGHPVELGAQHAPLGLVAAGHQPGGEQRRTLRQHALAAADVDDGRRAAVDAQHIVQDQEVGGGQDRDQQQAGDRAQPDATGELRDIAVGDRGGSGIGCGGATVGRSGGSVGGRAAMDRSLRRESDRPHGRRSVELRVACSIPVQQRPCQQLSFVHAAPNS